MCIQTHTHILSNNSLLITALMTLRFLSLQMDDEPFNPDYVEVDRVLDVSESTDENGEVLSSPSVIFHVFETHTPSPHTLTDPLVFFPCVCA